MKEANNDEARRRKKTVTMVVQQQRRSLPSILRDRQDTDLRANTDPDPGLLALVRQAQAQVGTRVTLSHPEARQLELGTNPGRLQRIREYATAGR